MKKTSKITKSLLFLYTAPGFSRKFFSSNTSIFCTKCKQISLSSNLEFTTIGSCLQLQKEGRKLPPTTKGMKKVASNYQRNEESCLQLSKEGRKLPPTNNFL